MPEYGRENGEAVAAASGGSRQVDDERTADVPARPRESMPCGVLTSIGAQRLGNARGQSLDHVAGGLRGDVPGGEARTARRQDELRPGRELAERARDRLAVVRHDPPLDLPAVRRETLDKQVSARVLSSSVVHPVRHRQHGGLHRTSLVFSSSRTPVTTMPLSIAFAMS